MKLWLNYWLCGVALGVVFLWRPVMAGAAVAKSTVLEGNVGYLLIAETGTNLTEEMQLAFKDLPATNPVAGVILDLRFATGENSASVKPAEYFLEQKKLPLAILVNAQTRGAAADLADDLREAGAGLIFGGPAMNLQPDISVSVNVNDEKDFLKNPYGFMRESDTNSNSSTNFLPFVDIDHTSEADLVREKIRDGGPDDSTAPATEQPEPQKAVIRDPVLARGLDFIKGVAALHLSKR